MLIKKHVFHIVTDMKKDPRMVEEIERMRQVERKKGHAEAMQEYQRTWEGVAIQM